MQKFSENSRFTKNLKWQFLGNAMQALLGGLYIVYIGRVLGPKDFGIFSSILAIVSVLGLVFEFRIQDVIAKKYYNLDEILIQKSDKYNNLINLYLIDIFSKLFPFVFVFVFIDYISSFIEIEYNKDLLFIYSFAWIFFKSGSSVAQGIFRVVNKNEINTLIISIEWASKLFFSILLNFFVGLDLFISVLLAIVVGVFCNFYQNIILFRELRNKNISLDFYKFNFNSFKSEIKSDKIFLISNMSVSVTNSISKDLDIVIVNYFSGSSSAGLYKMAKTGSYMIWRAIDPFYPALLPELQKLIQNIHYDKVKNLLMNTTKWLFLYSIILAFLTNFIVYYGTEIILGPKYNGLPVLMMQMTPWVLFCGPLIWANPLAIALNKPQYPSYGGILGMIAGLVLYLVLLPMMGLAGAAIAWNAVSIVAYSFVIVLSLYRLNAH